LNKTNTLEQAFVLHTRSYRETSLIADLFTRDKGKISVVAKGAKRPKSKLKSILIPTALLSVSYRGKKELKNLTHCEVLKYFSINSSVSLNSVIYLNELILKFLQKEQEHEDLFNLFSLLLISLEEEKDQKEVEKHLRVFELNLLKELGYSIDLVYEADSGEKIRGESFYSFDPMSGFILKNVKKGISEDIFKGKDILNLSKGDLEDLETRRASKIIMRRAIDTHLGNKSLNVRKLFLNKGENR